VTVYNACALTARSRLGLQQSRTIRTSGCKFSSASFSAIDVLLRALQPGARGCRCCTFNNGWRCDSLLPRSVSAPSALRALLLDFLRRIAIAWQDHVDRAPISFFRHVRSNIRRSPRKRRPADWSKSIGRSTSRRCIPAVRGMSTSSLKCGSRCGRQVFINQLRRAGLCHGCQVLGILGRGRRGAPADCAGPWCNRSLTG